MKKIMIYKTCAKELVIPLIAAIPEIVAVMFVDVYSTDWQQAWFGFQILDENNNLQTAFLNGEKFKILLPSNQDIEFEIRVEATFETNPIKLGKSPGEQWVSYVLLGKTEKKQANLLDYFKTNPQKEQENVEENKEEDKTQEVIQKEIINQIETPKKEIKKLPQTGF